MRHELQLLSRPRVLKLGCIRITGRPFANTDAGSIQALLVGVCGDMVIFQRCPDDSTLQEGGEPLARIVPTTWIGG